MLDCVSSPILPKGSTKRHLQILATHNTELRIREESESSFLINSIRVGVSDTLSGFGIKFIVQRDKKALNGSA